MIPDMKFISDCAKKHGHEPDDRILKWLSLYFSDEMWPGQYDELLLDSLIDLYCMSYEKQPEIFKIPTPADFYKKRYSDAKDVIIDLMSTIDTLESEIDDYRDQLEKAGILHPVSTFGKE